MGKLGLKPKESTIKIAPLGNSYVKNHGVVNVKLNNTNYKCIVVDKVSKQADILLGWPSLVKNNLSIKLSDESVSVVSGDEELKVTGEDKYNKRKFTITNNIKQTEIRTKKKLTIQPRSQRLIKIKYNQTHSQTKQHKHTLHHTIINTHEHTTQNWIWRDQF